MNGETEPTGPLKGVRVLDLTHVLNGPFATMLLAHMGAEVIKVEYGEGDRFRHAWMPPDADHDGYEFLAVNANKKCITLNLKNDRGRELFLGLVRASDVIVENFSLGVMDGLGFGYEQLKQINPRIIFATSKGYGESGPYASVRSFAPIALATSGWTASSWMYSGVEGVRVLGPGDEAAGVSLAVGICAALYNRSQSGVGQKIEVSMQEAVMGFMVSNFHGYFENRGIITARYYETKDGWFSTHLPDLTDELFVKYVTALGQPQIAQDSRFSTAQRRRENYPALEALFAEWVADMNSEDLFRILKQHNLAAGPILTIPEVLENEHVKARGAFVEVDHSEAGRLKLLAPWIRFSETPTKIDHAGAAIGEHTYEVYERVLGLEKDQIDDLKRHGAI